MNRESYVAPAPGICRLLYLLRKLSLVKPCFFANASKRSVALVVVDTCTKNLYICTFDAKYSRFSMGCAIDGRLSTNWEDAVAFSRESLKHIRG